MLGLLQKLVRTLLGNYYLFRIYRLDLSSAPPVCDPGFTIFSEPYDGEPENYAGPDSYGFAYEENGKRLCHCWVWYGERYRTRNFWPLKENEAKLIALETDETARGRGLAPKLLEYAAGKMGERGFNSLYARIWHSNQASVKAFEKAGLRYYALVVEFDLLAKRCRVILPRR